MPVSKIHLFWFQNKTDLLIKCDKDFDKIQVQGLVQIQDRPNCQLVTEDFSFTFFGENPEKVFNQSPIRVVNQDLMMNIAQPVEDEIEKSLKNLTATISGFDDTVDDLAPVQVTSIWNYANFSVALLVLTINSVLIIHFMFKCRQ